MSEGLDGYSTSLIVYLLAISTRKGHICRFCHPSRCMALLCLPCVSSCDIETYQAVKDVNASYDALADLLESMEHFINRLDIYTRIPSMEAMAEIIVKIMVELLSTLALVTKQIKQKRPSKCVLTDIPLV